MTFCCFAFNRRAVRERPLVLFFIGFVDADAFARIASSAASFARTAADARSTLRDEQSQYHTIVIPVPTREGSNAIVDGGSFSRSACTSNSRRCAFVSYGFAARVSKFGSPAPGTTILLNPARWPIACQCRALQEEGTYQYQVHHHKVQTARLPLMSYASDGSYMATDKINIMVTEISHLLSCSEYVFPDDSARTHTHSNQSSLWCSQCWYRRICTICVL